MPPVPHRFFVLGVALAIVALVVLGLPSPAQAHCDTLDGPVVAAARLALQRGDIQPVLKWVKPEAEAEVRAAFTKALAVRSAGTQARELADLYFFETLVRVHRAGEGAPYTGLKPAGSVAKPIALADSALEKGAPDALGRLIAEHLAQGLRERFTRVAAARSSADESPEAGRRYVAAYVDYVHYVEAVVHAIHAAGGHAHGAERRP